MDAVDLSFDLISFSDLEVLDRATLDGLAFGVVGLDRNGLVGLYNATEARLAGLAPDNVVGRSFFESVAQCMNNFMVAQRFDDEPTLDTIIPYVLALRMRPTPVRLRLLATPDARLRYILIERAK